MNGDHNEGRVELPNLKLPSFDPKFVQRAVVGLVVLVAILTSFFTVGPEEKGLILRFGKFERTTDPGLHFKAPFGIERVIKVPVQRQLKAEFGFRTLRADVQSQFATSPYKDEANILTGDLNAATVEWVVQYRIVDPYQYLFRVRNVEDTFRDTSEAVMRSVIGDRIVNEVLTVGRAEIAVEVQARLQESAISTRWAWRVDQVILKREPARPGQTLVQRVNEAQQEKAKLINQAQSEYNKVVPRARGEACRRCRRPRVISWRGSTTPAATAPASWLSTRPTAWLRT